MLQVTSFLNAIQTDDDCVSRRARAEIALNAFLENDVPGLAGLAPNDAMEAASEVRRMVDTLFEALPCYDLAKLFEALREVLCSFSDADEDLDLLIQDAWEEVALALYARDSLDSRYYEDGLRYVLGHLPSRVVTDDDGGPRIDLRIHRIFWEARLHSGVFSDEGKILLQRIEDAVLNYYASCLEFLRPGGSHAQGPRAAQRKRTLVVRIGCLLGQGSQGFHGLRKEQLSQMMAVEGSVLLDLFAEGLAGMEPDDNDLSATGVAAQKAALFLARCLGLQTFRDKVHAPFEHAQAMLKAQGVDPADSCWWAVAYVLYSPDLDRHL